MVQERGPTYRQLKSLTAEELMQRLHAQHPDALAVIVDRYQRLVWRVAEKILHDHGEAEDVVQIVFMEIFQKVALCDPNRGTFKVWLLQLAYSWSVNRLYHLARSQFYKQVGSG